MSDAEETDAQPEISISITIDGEESSWTVENERVKEILANVPREKLPEQVELMLNLGDTVLKCASVQTSDETIQKLFGGIKDDLGTKVANLEKCRETLEKMLAEQVPTGIKDKLAAELKVYLTALQELKEQIPEKIKAQIAETVTQLQGHGKALQESSQTLGNFINRYHVPKERGTLGETAVLDSLQHFFRDQFFENVSTTAHSTDIKAQAPDMVPVLVEVKNYSETVPKKEVDKFWGDLETNNTPVGCFLSLNTSIGAGIADYKVVMQGNNVGVFLNVGQFFGEGGIQEGIQLGFFIAQQFARYLKRMELERSKEGDMRQKVAAIYKQVGDLKAQVEPLTKVITELNKISTSVTKQTQAIETIRLAAINRITTILQGEESAVEE